MNNENNENKSDLVFRGIINTGEKIDLSCGCRIPLGHVLALAGLQHLEGKEVLCPLHGTPHQYSTNKSFLQTAVTFLELSRQQGPTKTVIGDEEVTILSSSSPPYAALFK